jgi:hypothetical protein
MKSVISVIGPLSLVHTATRMRFNSLSDRVPIIIEKISHVTAAPDNDATQRKPCTIVNLNRAVGRFHTQCLALQLPFLWASESIGNHDSKIMDACGVG